MTFETLSIERIFLAGYNYPNLHELNIYLMNKEIDIALFTG